MQIADCNVSMMSLRLRSLAVVLKWGEGGNYPHLLVLFDHALDDVLRLLEQELLPIPIIRARSPALMKN
eukprot:scaffold495_cov243-Pinguiococcus_pyrenoidosus.AAC.40